MPTPSTVLPPAPMPLRVLLLAAIAAYQRHLSPHKGFHCAYRVHTGRASCSALAYRAVRRHGVRAGLGLLRQRLRRCGEAHRSHSAFHSTLRRNQAGFCDISCDLPCDGGGVEGCLDAADLASACDCGSCDWPSRGRRQRDPAPSVRPPGLG